MLREQESADLLLPNRDVVQLDLDSNVEPEPDSKSDFEPDPELESLLEPEVEPELPLGLLPGLAPDGVSLELELPPELLSQLEVVPLEPEPSGLLPPDGAPPACVLATAITMIKIR